MGVVERFISEAKMTSTEVQSLITNTTSDRFDQWVESMHEKHSKKITEADIDDIPF